MGTGEKTPSRGRCVIIAAGELEPELDLRALTDGAGLIVCADGGYNTAVAHEVLPDLFVGDMDSVTATPTGCERVITPAEKDDTDTLLAVKLALARGFDHIVIAGGLGGRLDHTIANLQTLLYCTLHGARAELAGVRNSALMIRDQTVTLDRRPGYVSVFALGGPCEGVTLEGLRYPLNDAYVTESFPIGVSNEFRKSQARITVRSGCLLVVFSENPAAGETAPQG